jgi:RNA polymerase sigma-70 factor (ECF subfamily)
MGRVCQEDPEGPRPELAGLLRQYLPAIRAHLLRKRRIHPDRVDDLLQTFVADKVLQQNVIEKADQLRGRFRTFILTAVENFLISQQRYEYAARRSPGTRTKMLELDDQRDAEPSCREGDVFDRTWAREVIGQALQWMKQVCDETQRQREWVLFDKRIVGPVLREEPEADYSAIIKEFGFISYSQATKAMTRAKRLYVQCLREVVGQYVVNAEEVDAEIIDLQRVVAGG